MSSRLLRSRGMPGEGRSIGASGVFVPAARSSSIKLKLPIILYDDEFEDTVEVFHMMFQSVLKMEEKVHRLLESLSDTCTSLAASGTVIRVSFEADVRGMPFRRFRSDTLTGEVPTALYKFKDIFDFSLPLIGRTVVDQLSSALAEFAVFERRIEQRLALLQYFSARKQLVEEQLRNPEIQDVRFVDEDLVSEMRKAYHGYYLFHDSLSDDLSCFVMQRTCKMDLIFRDFVALHYSLFKAMSDQARFVTTIQNPNPQFREKRITAYREHFEQIQRLKRKAEERRREEEAERERERAKKGTKKKSLTTKLFSKKSKKTERSLDFGGETDGRDSKMSDREKKLKEKEMAKEILRLKEKKKKELQRKDKEDEELAKVARRDHERMVAQLKEEKRRKQKEEEERAERERQQELEKEREELKQKEMKRKEMDRVKEDQRLERQKVEKEKERLERVALDLKREQEKLSQMLVEVVAKEKVLEKMEKKKKSKSAEVELVRKEAVKLRKKYKEKEKEWQKREVDRLKDVKTLKEKEKGRVSSTVTTDKKGAKPKSEKDKRKEAERAKTQKDKEYEKARIEKERLIAKLKTEKMIRKKDEERQRQEQADREKAVSSEVEAHVKEQLEKERGDSGLVDAESAERRRALESRNRERMEPEEKAETRQRANIALSRSMARLSDLMKESFTDGGSEPVAAALDGRSRLLREIRLAEGGAILGAKSMPSSLDVRGPAETSGALSLPDPFGGGRNPRVRAVQQQSRRRFSDVLDDIKTKGISLNPVKSSPTPSRPTGFADVLAQVKEKGLGREKEERMRAFSGVLFDIQSRKKDDDAVVASEPVQESDDAEMAASDGGRFHVELSDLAKPQTFWEDQRDGKAPDDDRFSPEDHLSGLKIRLPPLGAVFSLTMTSVSATLRGKREEVAEETAVSSESAPDESTSGPTLQRGARAGRQNFKRGQSLFGKRSNVRVVLPTLKGNNDLPDVPEEDNAESPTTRIPAIPAPELVPNIPAPALESGDASPAEVGSPVNILPPSIPAPSLDEESAERQRIREQILSEQRARAQSPEVEDVDEDDSSFSESSSFADDADKGKGGDKAPRTSEPAKPESVPAKGKDDDLSSDEDEIPVLPKMQRAFMDRDQRPGENASAPLRSVSVIEGKTASAQTGTGNGHVLDGSASTGSLVPGAAVYRPDQEKMRVVIIADPKRAFICAMPDFALSEREKRKQKYGVWSRIPPSKFVALAGVPRVNLVQVNLGLSRVAPPLSEEDQMLRLRNELPKRIHEFFGVSKGNLKFEDILDHAVSTFWFKRFTMTEHSEENFLFFLKVERYRELALNRDMPDDSVFSSAEQLFEVFICRDSDYEVNVDRDCVRKIEEAIAEMREKKIRSANMFDSAQKEILELLEKNIFVRFEVHQFAKDLEVDLKAINSKRVVYPLIDVFAKEILEHKEFGSRFKPKPLEHDPNDPHSPPPTNPDDPFPPLFLRYPRSMYAHDATPKPFSFGKHLVDIQCQIRDQQRMRQPRFLTATDTLFAGLSQS